MRSTDLPADVLAQVRSLRERTGLSTAILLERCLQAFENGLAPSSTHIASKSLGKRPTEIDREAKVTSPGDSLAQTPKKRPRKKDVKKPEAASPKAASQDAIQSQASEVTGPKVKAGRKSTKRSQLMDRQPDMFPLNPANTDNQN